VTRSGRMPRAAISSNTSAALPSRPTETGAFAAAASEHAPAPRRACRRAGRGSRSRAACRCAPGRPRPRGRTARRTPRPAAARRPCRRARRSAASGRARRRRSAGARPRRRSRRCPARCPASRCRSTSRPSSGRTSSGPCDRARRSGPSRPTCRPGWSWRSARAARTRGCGTRRPACPTAPAASRRRRGGAASRRWRRSIPSCARPADAAVDHQLSGFSATSGSRLFISIRSAASCTQPRQLSSPPRGARTMRPARKRVPAALVRSSS
jgi:hypothetical protein